MIGRGRPSRKQQPTTSVLCGIWPLSVMATREQRGKNQNRQCERCLIDQSVGSVTTPPLVFRR
jgi:hypothetical protein